MDNETLIEEGRDWLSDIFPEDADEIEEASEKTIRQNVNNLYEGGWPAFVQSVKHNTI